MRVLLFAIAFTYLMMCGLVLTFEDRLIYWPERGGRVVGPGDDVWLRADDGVLLHARYTARDPLAPTLLYLHGTAGNLASRSDRLELFSNLGANLLALEYRGYGRSSGTPSEDGLYRDARAAYEWLARKTDAQKIVLFGESLGGGPACEVASTRLVGGLILLSTSTSLPDVATALLPFLPMRWMMQTHYDNLRKIAHVSAPKLFIHGRSDEIVPFEMAERLYAAAAAPKEHLWLAHAGHDETFYTERKLTTETMKAFLNRLR